MGVRLLVAFEITCDWPSCGADFLTDPPQGDAIAAARRAGWTVSGTGHGRKARCPGHGRTHLRGRHSS